MLKNCFLFLAFLSARFCFAQDTIPTTNKWKSNNVVKTNVLGYFRQMTFFSYERVLTKSVSIMGTYGQGHYKITGKKAEDNLVDKTRGLGFPCTQEIKIHSSFSIEPRYYISFKHYRIPAGFHIGPSINFVNGSEIFTSTGDFHGPVGGANYGTYVITTKAKKTAVLINIGPQLLIKRIVALDISVGIGYGKESGIEEKKYSNAPQDGTTSNYSDTGFNLAFSVSMGIAFGK
jgi:hypothetical protein